jgi:hypothetical protein
VGYTVDQKAARAADALPAVVFEGNGRFPLTEKVLIEGVQHFKE